PVYNQDFELIGTASEIDQLADIQEATDGFLAVQATDNPLWVEVVGTEETYYIPTVPVAEAPEEAAVFTVNDGVTVDEYVAAMQDGEFSPVDQGGEINVAAVDSTTADSILGEDVLILRPVTIGGSTYIPVVPAEGSEQVYFIPLASIPYEGVSEPSGPDPIPVTITEDGGAQVYAPMFAEQEVPLPFMDQPYLQDEGRDPQATMFSVDQILDIGGTLEWGQEIGSLQIVADQATLNQAVAGLEQMIAAGQGATEDYQIALDILTGDMPMPEDSMALQAVVGILINSFLDLNDYTRENNGTVFFEADGTTPAAAAQSGPVDFSFELFAYEQQGDAYLPYSPDGYQPQTEQVFTGWVPVDGVTLGEGVTGAVTQLAVDPADQHSLYGYIQGMGWVRIGTTDAVPADVEDMFNEQFGVEEEGGILQAIGTGFGYIIDVPEAWVGAAIFDVGEIFGDENLQAVGLSTIGYTWIGDLAGIDTEFALNWAFDVDIPDNEILWRQASYDFMSMFNEVGAAAYENGDTGAMFLAGAGKFVWTAFEFYTLSTVFSGAGELIAGGEGAAAWQTAAAYILTEAGPRAMMLPMYAQMGEQAWALVSGDLEGGEQWVAATDLISFFGGSATMTVVSGVRQGRVTDLRSAGTAAATDAVRNVVFIGSTAASEALFGTPVPGLTPVAGVTVADIYNHFRPQTSSSTDIVAQETNYAETLQPVEHTITIDQATGLVIDDFVARDINGNVIAAGRVITNPQTGAQAYRVVNDTASPAASQATSAVMSGVSGIVGEVNASETAIVPVQQDPFAIAPTGAVTVPRLSEGPVAAGSSVPVFVGELNSVTVAQPADSAGSTRGLLGSDEALGLEARLNETLEGNYLLQGRDVGTANLAQDPLFGPNLFSAQPEMTQRPGTIFVLADSDPEVVGSAREWVKDSMSVNDDFVIVTSWNELAEVLALPGESPSSVVITLHGGESASLSSPIAGLELPNTATGEVDIVSGGDMGDLLRGAGVNGENTALVIFNSCNSASGPQGTRFIDAVATNFATHGLSVGNGDGEVRIVGGRGYIVYTPGTGGTPEFHATMINPDGFVTDDWRDAVPNLGTRRR
ncbi:MAG: hypothetical protein PHR11_02600, partial [Candidatus Omnitrophica bacterium]|nr:hypothetical protein [Candidatus Omnitrophota bacterium]